MTPEQKAAYIMAQAAVLNAEVAGMVSENQARSQSGSAPAYGEKAFTDLINASGVHHNAVLTFFEEA